MAERVLPPAPDRTGTPERLGYNDGLVAFKARAALGGNALDPSNRSLPEITANMLDPLNPQKNVTYALFNAASTHERTEYWQKQGVNGFDAQKQAWIQRTTADFQGAKEYFTQSGWKTTLARIGINTDTFSEADANQLYSRYFGTDNGASRGDIFIAHVLSSYANENTIDYTTLKRDLPAWQWLTGMYGQRGALVLAQLTDMEATIRTPEELQRLITAVNEKSTVDGAEVLRSNNLEDEEIIDLEYLWGARSLFGEKPDQPPPSPEPDTPPVDSPPTPPDIETVPKSEAINNLKPWFENIEGEVDKNSRYYMENPPEKLNLTPEQMKVVELKVPFYAKIKEGFIGPDPKAGFSGELMANPKNGSYTLDFKEMNDRLQALGLTREPHERFNNAEEKTDGDSGVHAVAAIAAETPEKQAQVYKTLADTILAINQNNPSLLRDWYIEQAKPFDEGDENSDSTLGYFFRFDGKRNDVNERLIMDVQRLLSMEELQALWRARQDELTTRLQSGQLEKHHLRWIEFLSHSVNVRELLNMMKN